TEAVTVTYLTDPDIVAAVLPKPLEPAAEPLVRVQLQRVRIEGMAPFGSAVFSVTARHGERHGDYPLFMPQSTEQSVTGGRETFGEPKKVARIEVERDGDRVTAAVDRLGYQLTKVNGRVTGPAELPPDQVNTEFYFKFLRAPDGGGLTDPHLVYGEYHRHYEVLEHIDGSLELGESPAHCPGGADRGARAAGVAAAVRAPALRRCRPARRPQARAGPDITHGPLHRHFGRLPRRR